MKQDTDVAKTSEPPLERVWLRRTIALILGLACFRIFYALVVPVDLVHDEAYYWDWSRQLDWGYYSKPPMVAWLIAMATRLGGASAFVVRCPAVVLGTLGLAWAYLLASRLYGARAGFWAVMIAAATPGNAVLSLLMTIDAPLLFAWGAALYSFWRMLEAGKHQWRWVLATVISVGLGLLSKQTMLAFPVLGGIFVLTSREDRRKLLRPAFWIVSFGSLAFLAPTLWWNSQHGWITAEHTSQHFAREPVSWSTRLIRCAEFVGGQFGVFSPVTCFLILTVTAVAMATFWRFGRKERYLLCFSGPPLAGVFALSLMQRVEPNWPAVFYLPTIVLLVGQGLGHLDLRLWPKVDAAALRRAVVVGWVAVAATYLLAAGLGLQGTKLDAAVRLRGWRQLADAVSQRCAVLSSPGRTFLVVAAGRALASELAFYMPDQPRVYLWTPGDKIISQYDLWGGPKDKAGFDAIIVTPRDAAAPAELSAAFDRIEDCGLVEVPIGAGRSHGYRLWRGIRFSNWPDKPYLSRKSDMQVQRR